MDEWASWGIEIIDTFVAYKSDVTNVENGKKASPPPLLAPLLHKKNKVGKRMPHVNKQMASFFLTTKCNLICEYCYNREERTQMLEQSLPIEIAKAGVDLFFNESPSRHIRFYGPGEPTQEIELMKEIVTYAGLKAGSNLIIELQTNGVFKKKRA